jgi:hypothetical protein
MRVSIPEKGTYIDFPEGTPPEEIQAAIEANWDTLTQKQFSDPNMAGRKVVIDEGQNGGTLKELQSTEQGRALIKQAASSPPLSLVSSHTSPPLQMAPAHQVRPMATPGPISTMSPEPKRSIPTREELGLPNVVAPSSLPPGLYSESTDLFEGRPYVSTSEAVQGAVQEVKGAIETPMTAAVVAGIATNPTVVVPALAAFYGIDWLESKALGEGRTVADELTSGGLTREAANLLEFGVKAMIAGKGAKAVEVPIKQGLTFFTNMAKKIRNKEQKIDFVNDVAAEVKATGKTPDEVVKTIVKPQAVVEPVTVPPEVLAEYPKEKVMVGTALVPKENIPRYMQQIDDAITTAQTSLWDTDTFINSPSYNGSFPIPKEGGIVAAKNHPLYKTNTEYAAQVDSAINDITSTIVDANRKRMLFRNETGTPEFGVSYNIVPDKVSATRTVNVGRAWNMEAKAKYPNVTYLGDVAVREGVQNSLDAVLTSIQNKEINKGVINITTTPKSFEISDNGIGMSDIDIRDKFLALHSTGKDVQGRFGGFGVAKAVILGPDETARWELRTRDNFFTNEMADQNSQIGTVPKRQGTLLKVETDNEITTNQAKMYAETTETPNNIDIVFNGNRVVSPFKGKKGVMESVAVDDKTNYDMTYYPKPPTEYEKQTIIRLVDDKTGSKLTQAILPIWNDGFKGAVMVDIKTTATPGDWKYPLTGSRMELKWDSNRPIAKLIEEKSVDTLTSTRAGLKYKDDLARYRPEWAKTIQETKTDEGYQNLLKTINDIFKETNEFFGHGQQVTPIDSLPVRIDIGYKGYKGGSLFQAKHLAAYEAVARLTSTAAGAPVPNFYGLLSKEIDGGRIASQYGAINGLGLNYLAVDKTALKSAETYALYLKQLIDHEFSHRVFGRHNEEFSAYREGLGNRTAHLFPFILRIAEATLGKESSLSKTKIVTKEVPVTKIVETERIVDKPYPVKERTYLTPEQMEFIFDYEKGGIDANTNLYLPEPARAGRQGGLFRGEYDRDIIGRDSSTSGIRPGGSVQQSYPQSPPESYTRSMGSSPTKTETLEPSQLAERTEQSAIEAKLTDSFGTLAGYEKMNMADQAAKAKAILDGDYEAAKRMAMGQDKPPGDVREATMYEAVKIRALEEGDVDTLRALATESTIPSKLSEYGQAIKAADSTKMLDDPVAAMQDVAKTRAESNTRTGRKTVNPVELETLQKKVDDLQARLDEYTSGKTVDKVIEAETKKPPREQAPWGSRNKIITPDAYTAAKAELSSIFSSQLSAGIDPVAVLNLGKIATYHFEAGARAFSSWSAMMVNDLGPKVKPYLEDLWNKTKETFPKSVVDSHLAKITKASESGKELSDMGRQVQELAKHFVSEGVTERGALVDAVHGVLKDVIPNITVREVQDAISGYGKYKLLSKDEIMVKLRDIKGQLQQVSKLEDLESRRPPLKTGIERRTQSDEERRLISLVGDLKREYGIETTDPATQLKSSLASLKTRMKNETVTLARKLQDLDLANKQRRTIELDPEAVKLRAARDVAKENLKAAQSAKGTVTREEAAEIVRLSKVTSDLKAKYDAETETWTSPEDGHLYGAARVAYDKYIDALKDVNAPIKTLIKDRLAQFKTETQTNPIKAVFNIQIDAMKKIANNSVGLVASLDNSFLGRQGLKTLMFDVRQKILHPSSYKSSWWPGAKQSFVSFYQTLKGNDAHDAVLADLYSKPKYLNGEYHTAKILAKTEEQYPEGLMERVPGLGRVFTASENAFRDAAIVMRTGLYDFLSEKAKKNGVESTKENIEGLGKFINSMTARGQWGKQGDNSVVRLVLWAPKMLMGNINVLTAHGFGAGLPNSFLRKQAAYNLLGIVAETALVMVIADAIKPGSVEWNPQSSDFGKINSGTKKTGQRFDITAGMGSIVTLAARMITGQSKSITTGNIIDYEPGIGHRTRFDALSDFLVNKTNPPMSVVRDMLKGRNFGRKDFSLARSAYQATTPITAQQAIQLKDDAEADRIAGVIADALGISSSNPTQYEK